MAKEGGQGVEGWRQSHMQQGDVGEQRVQVQPQQQPPPKQCPRCGSKNTKFCYYNNHKLTQPRYLCKSCRRNWTQGGILRDIPIGSSSRKGKRAKYSSFSRSQQPSPQPPPPPPTQGVVFQNHHPNLTTVMKSKYPFALETPSTSPLYQGDSGYLSSIPANPSPNPSQSHPFDQYRKFVDDGFGSFSNLGPTSGSKVGSLSFLPQIQPLQFYQMDGKQREVQLMHASQQGLMVSSSMSNTNSDASSHYDKPHNNETSNSPLWSTINNNTTFISGTGWNASVFGSNPLLPNHQWPGFSGFGPPPSSD